MTPLKIGIITGSTRPGRSNEAVARWVLDIVQRRTDAQFELVDIADFNLPLFDEPASPMFAPPTKPHSKAWSAKIASLDAFVFVTPEYNHSIPGALKNALDFLYYEWNNKVAGFVSYGGSNGVRAVEHLRGVMAELQVATVRAHVGLSLVHDFEGFTKFKPLPHHDSEVTAMVDQVISWGTALRSVRSTVAA